MKKLELRQMIREAIKEQKALMTESTSMMWRTNIDIPEDAWRKFVAYTRKAIRFHKVKVCGSNGKGKPEFTKEYIAFNGDASKDDDYESFVLYRVADSGSCKTGGRPYGSPIRDILKSLKKRFPDTWLDLD